MKAFYKYASGLVLTGFLSVLMISSVSAQRGVGGHVGGGVRMGGGGGSVGVGFHGNSGIGFRGNTGFGVRGGLSYRSGTGYYGGLGYHGGAIFRPRLWFYW